jgi:hypothetical protein
MAAATFWGVSDWGETTALSGPIEMMEQKCEELAFCGSRKVTCGLRSEP